jgi:hypothetical protein
VAVLTTSGTALAQSPASAARAPATDEEIDKQARELMKTGIAEARKGDLEAARGTFVKAWELRPDTNLAVLLARIEMKLGRYREAAERWEYYLQNVPPDPATAAEKLAECRQHLGSVKVTGEPPGAFVFVDGRKLGPTPLPNDIWLDPGDHTIMARLGERSSPEHKLTLAKGEQRTLTLVLSPPEPAPAAHPEPPRADTQPPTSRDDRGTSSARTIVVVSGSVLTAGALVTGIFYTLRANSLSDQMTVLKNAAMEGADPDSIRDASYCAPWQPNRSLACEELVRTADQHDTAKGAAIGAYIAAGVLGTGTVVTYLLWPKGSGTEATRPLEVMPFASGRGVQLRMKF